MRNSTTYKLGGTKTFRRSSTKILSYWGSNLQNIEKLMREIYMADGPFEELKAKCKYWLETGDLSVFTEEELVKLRVLIQSDQSGADALMVAYESEPKDYRQLFIHNVKPHVYVAMKLFKDVWTKKLKESGGLVEDFDIDVLCNTPICDLKKNPFWKDLDLLIKSSDNWPLTERYYYFAKQTVHCFDKETEVLTPRGWVTIDCLSNKESVAIYDGHNIKFEKPSSLIMSQYCGDMIWFKGEEIDQYVTPNHKMVYITNGIQHVEEASYVQRLSRVNVPTSGLYEGGQTNLQQWQVKLLVAIQADGYIESVNRVRFKFAKDRKIDRLREILIEGNLDYTFQAWVDTTSAGNIVSDFGVLCPELISMFDADKTWGSWLLNLSKDNLITLVNELKFWDGTYTSSYQHKREEYMSSKIKNIDWIKTICHLIDKQGTIGLTDSCGTTKIGINSRTNSIAKRKSIHKFNGMIYCLTVSTGMFMVRRNGKISVTHNSANYDIQPPNFRMNVLEKSGGKILLPKDEAERFLLVYRSIFPEIPERNRRVERQVRETRMLFNIFGFPYQITDWNLSDNKMKEWYAWSPQSSVGEITRIAYSRLQEFIESEHKNWDLLADTHDSYLAQCPLMEVSECKSKMKEYMNQKLISPYDGTEFWMKSEQNVGMNWSSYKKDKNDLGLRELTWN